MASGATSVSQSDLNEMLFTAMDMGHDELVSQLLDRGAVASSRSAATQQLVHTILLSRPDPNVALICRLFKMHCELDAQIGALVESPLQLATVELALTELAISGWQGSDSSTVLHRVIDSCRLGALGVAQATLLSKRLLDVDPTLLTAEDVRGNVAGDLAMQCQHAVELERLVTVVVHGAFQLLHPSVTLYRSQTALVMDCRDLSTSALATSMWPEASLVIKLMTDAKSWRREISSRFTLGPENGIVVPIVSISSSDASVADVIQRYPEISRSGSGNERASHQLARDLMLQYPFAIVMEKADRDLLEIITNERLAVKPLESLKITARKIGLNISALHNKGMIHGDIKPRNLVRMADRSFMCIDLDMAYSPLSQDGSMPTTCTTRALVDATGANVAPEHLDNTCVPLSTSRDGGMPTTCATKAKVDATSAYAAPELLKWVHDNVTAQPVSLEAAIQFDICEFLLLSLSVCLWST